MTDEEREEERELCVLRGVWSVCPSVFRIQMRRKLTAVHLKMRWIIFVAFAVPVFGRG